MKLIHNKHAQRTFIISLICFVSLFFIMGLSPEGWEDHDGLKAESLAWRLSMAFAYTSVIMLAITLSIGPLNVILRQNNPTHNPTRRAFGMAAAMFGLLHLVYGINIHWDGWAVYWQFIRLTDGGFFPVRPRVDTHGIANNLGLLQAILFITLIFLSTNRAIRQLGLRLWKQLQRLSYVILLSILIHGLLYQAIEQRHWMMRLVFLLIIIMVIALQIIGIGLRITRERRNPVQE